jgi:hypothetical protein
VSTWRRDPRVLWRRSGDGFVLLPPGSEELVVLEDVAALVWSLLERPVDEAQLVVRLARRFGSDTVTVETDVGPFLRRLRDRGVLDSSRSAPT